MVINNRNLRISETATPNLSSSYVSLANVELTDKLVSNVNLAPSLDFLDAYDSLQVGIFDRWRSRQLKFLQTAKHFNPPKLRDYQASQVRTAFELFKSGITALILQAPTGAGKSKTSLGVILPFVNDNQPILVIVHKDELVHQWKRLLEDATGMDVGVIKAGFKPNPDALIQIATIQTLVKRGFPPAALVIVDEAHHCASPTYTCVISHYRGEGAYIVGLTATPMRLDGRGLRFLHNGVPGFDALITGPSYKLLNERGYLCEVKLFAGQGTTLDPEAVGIPTKAGDYSETELADYVESIDLAGEIVDTWLKHAAGRRTILYPVSVKLSRQYCQEFNDRNIPAAHIDANTHPTERARIIDAFTRGEILVLCQHSIVIEGVDIPLIECIQFARPTKSLTIWFQAIGRALRPAPGKTHAVIIDHTTTHQELPWVTDEIDWSLDPISLPEGTKNSLQCPECNHVFRANHSEVQSLWATCPNCQTKFTFEVGTGKGKKPPRVVEILPADFKEVDFNAIDPVIEATISRLIEIQKARSYKAMWVYYEVAKAHPDIGLRELKHLAKLLGFKSGWGWFKYQELQVAKGEAI